MDIPATIAQDLNLPSDIHLQIRKIRNIEVGKSDLLPLILGNKKIPSTPINAYGYNKDSWGEKDYFTMIMYKSTISLYNIAESTSLDP